MKKVFVIVISLFLISSFSFSQSKTQIEELNILSKKTYYIDFEDSDGDESIELVERYNEKGQLMEEFIYHENGKIDKHYKYEYNEGGKIIKEIRFFPNGKIKKTIEYKYNDKGLKIEKIVYDSKDIVVSKKRYEYTYK